MSPSFCVLHITVTFLLIGIYHTERRIIKLSKSASSVVDPMALFQCLQLWQQPFEPFPTPETYPNLSPVSVPWCLTTSLRYIFPSRGHRFGFFYLYTCFYKISRTLIYMKPEIKSWFQIYYGRTDENPKYPCVSLICLGKHGKNKNVCQTTKTAKGFRSRCGTLSYFSFYPSLPN